MRFAFVFCFLAWQMSVPIQLHAQVVTDEGVATQLPPSLSSVPQNAAFCYGVHNGAEFAKMMSGSKLALQLAQSGVIEIAVDAIAETLGGGELDLGVIKFDFDDATEQTKDVIQAQQSDLYDLARQLFANDAILIGDESWSTTWESLSKSILIARNNLSLVEGEGDSLKVEGSDSLVVDESFARIRVPNTVLSFQLTDTAPATRLLEQIAKSIDDAMPEALAGWKYHEHAIETDALAVFSYELDRALIAVSDKEEMDTKELAEREQLLDVFRGRSFQFGIGVVKSRGVIFVGEDIQCVADLVGVGANQTKRLVARREFGSLLPELDGILIASAYVSDRFAKSADALGNKGLLSNLTSFVSNLGGMVKVGDVPIDQAAIAMGVPNSSWMQLSSKLKFLSERWDALAAPNAGWAATISASPSGIIGRSVSRTVDPRLPATPLRVDQHVGDDVIAFYARQGTTTTERCFLVYEFVSQASIGFAKMMIGFAEEEGVGEAVDLHYRRLNQMPLRLAKIVNDSLLPALGDGGQAFVLTRFDPTPGINDNVPVEISFVSGVVNNQELKKAGEMSRQWVNSLVNQYCEIIKKIDPDEADMEVPTLAAPIVADDGDSSVFALVALTSEEDSVDADVSDEPPAEMVVWDMSSIGALFHWRLSEDVLAMGTNVLITKNMLTAKQAVPAERGLGPYGGILRAVTWIDAHQIAKIYEGIDDADTQSFAKLVGCIDSYQRITTTQNGNTVRRWKIATKLGEQ